jgi:hypothetical protein
MQAGVGLALKLLQQVLAVRVAAVRVAFLVALRQLLILAVAGEALTATRLFLAAQAVQGLSLFPTQAHKEAQAAQSHQAVATPFIHLQLAALLRHDYARAPERAF